MNDSEKPKSSWREHRQSIKYKWLAPFIFPEWLCELVSYFLGQWAFLDILGHAGRLTILVAVIFYFAESGSRQKAKHYQAWQVINAAQGKPRSGGRIDALQDLYREGISLAGVDISKAHLPKLNLKNANLWDANLTEAKLLYANLSGARFGRANLTRAVLSDANLAGADLREANLTGATLQSANLTGADIESITNWQGIQNIELANIYGVKEAPEGFIEWAIEHGAVRIEDDEEFEKFMEEKGRQK